MKRKKTKLSLKDFRLQISETVNRVAYGNEQFNLTHHGKPLVTIVPVDKSNSEIQETRNPQSTDHEKDRKE